MSSVLFFILVCLGPMAVMCDHVRWTPLEVPSTAMQCRAKNPLTVGECEVTRRRGSAYIATAPCQSLKCAVLRPDGTFELRRLGRPLDGTSCGASMACRSGKCVVIDRNHTPVVIGLGIKVPCEPTSDQPARPPKAPKFYTAKKGSNGGV